MADQIDPGSASLQTQTPAGTGRLGSPGGAGLTYADLGVPGSNSTGSALSTDGVVDGSNVASGMLQDGTGQR
jgi:hypothetical protein